MVMFIKFIFALAVLIVAGYAFCDIVSAEGWMSGLVFLIVLPFFLGALLMPFALLSSLFRRFR